MNDRELTESIKSGNSHSLSRIYEAYRNEFIGWIYKDFKCSLEEAKDIYQASILILYKNIVDGKFASGSSIKTYLFAIGRNQFLKQRKTEQRFSGVIIDNILDDHDDAQESKASFESNLELVHNSLQVLGDPCKKLLELSYFFKSSIENITLVLGYKNADTTKNLKYKCLQRLRKIIQSESMKSLGSAV